MLSVKGMALKAIKLLQSKTPTIVDVGAYIGGTSLRIMDELPGATVYAIEACPQNYRSIIKRSEGKIKVFNLAISDCCKRVSLFVASQARAKKHNASSGSNSLFKDFIGSKSWAKKVAIVRIPSMTLDGFCKENEISQIDLLKINCEGCEYKIFSGPTEFLKFTKILILQMHAHCKTFDSQEFRTKRDNIYKGLKSNGFKLKEHSGKRGSHITQMWLR